eukprot:g15513.t1
MLSVTAAPGVLYYIISYLSYHIISYHIISYHIISYHIISYHIISYHIISYHIISYHITSHHITSSHHIILYLFIPRIFYIRPGTSSYSLSKIAYLIITSHHITSYITSHHIMPYHIVSYLPDWTGYFFLLLVQDRLPHHHIASTSHHIMPYRFVSYLPDWTRASSYSFSKIANLWFTHELQRRVTADEVFVYCVHPGTIRTGIAQHLHPVLQFLFKWVGPLFTKSPEEGAQTTLYCATQPVARLRPGGYYSDCEVAQPSKLASDSKQAAKFWKISEEWCGL